MKPLLFEIVLYFHPSKEKAAALAKAELKDREEALAAEKTRLGMTD
jgi:pre-mRNA branch site protein p14